MDYFGTDDSEKEPMKLETQIEPDVPITEPVEAPQNEIPADTIEISREATNHILQSVEKQPSKYWHFQFKNDGEKEKFTEVLQTVPGYKLTAEYGIKQDTPDITLRLGEQIVGKIHLLLCDRRDVGNRDKYYCKIYFYHFKDPKLYGAVKAAVVNFFEGFKSSNNQMVKRSNNLSNKPSLNNPSMGGKRKRRTHKKKRMNKKKTHRRK